MDFLYRSYVANRVTDKLTQVTDHIYCCRSGSAADTQAIADKIRYQLDLYRYSKTSTMLFTIVHVEVNPNSLYTYIMNCSH